MAITVQDVRHLLGDASESVISDAAIESILVYENNVYTAAATCAFSIAAKVASSVDMDAKGVSLKTSQKYAHWSDLAKRYSILGNSGKGNIGDSPSATVPGPILTGVSVQDIAVVQSDSDRYSSAFVRGMDDNPTIDALQTQPTELIDGENLYG